MGHKICLNELPNLAKSNGTNHGICRVNFFNIDFDLKFGYCLSRVTQKYLSFQKIPRFSAPNSPLKF